MLLHVTRNYLERLLAIRKAEYEGITIIARRRRIHAFMKPIDP
jgi:hypothetical protein